MKYIFIRILVISVVLGCGYTGAISQETSAGNSSPTVATVENSAGSNESEMREKIKRLEAQVQLMQKELEALKVAITKVGKEETVSQTAVTRTTPAMRAPAGSDTATTTDKGKALTINAGDVKITPYGIVFFNAFANSGGTNNTDIPLWATSRESGDAGASGRQTRFGVRIEGGKIGTANVKGVVEADFFGGFPAIGVGENFGVVRLRLAYVKFDWEKTSLVLGQDWIPFAPNSPQSLASAAIPQMAAAGNMWSRLPQARVDRKFGNGFMWQGAVLAPGTGDFPVSGNPALLQPSTGSASRMPFFQSRISYSNGKWLGTGKAGTIGIAAHYGRSRVTNGNSSNNIDSIGFAADWNFPLAKRVSMSGEAFFGRNLAGFQAGIFQGYNNDFAYRQGNTLVAAGVRGIGTRGGWTQLGYNVPAFRDRLSIYGSVGIDDPRNADLITLSNRNFRSRNLVYAFDAIFKLTPQLSFGAEVRRFDTSYLFNTSREGTHLNLAGTYVF